VRVKDGQRLEFKTITYPATQDMALAIQPMLKGVGIAMEIEPLEFGTWLTRYRVGSYEVSVASWFNFVIDPRLDLQNHFLSPRANDVSGYTNERVQQLFGQARTASNREEEVRLYGQIQELVANDVVYVYLWRAQDLLAGRTSLAVPQAKTMSEIWSKAPLWQKGV
jgi:peptide/nickel transport system substrate-binding protein